MKRAIIAMAGIATACAATYPVPVQRMADAQSARRSAVELGANNLPDAQLYLKLSEEEIAKANVLLKENENRRADFMLIRAKADGELAVAIARAKKSEAEEKQSLDQQKLRAKTIPFQGAR